MCFTACTKFNFKLFQGNKNNPKGQFDDESGDYSTWVPPVGQSGDGRTKLNDKLGY